MAEHFRDAEGQDVLLFIDNIFRFTQVSPDKFASWYVQFGPLVVLYVTLA